MMFKSDNDSWEDQALYDWRDVEEEIIYMITKRMKETALVFPEDKGTYYLIAPFMETHGYMSFHGTWLKS